MTDKGKFEGTDVPEVDTTDESAENAGASHGELTYFPPADAQGYPIEGEREGQAPQTYQSEESQRPPASSADFTPETQEDLPLTAFDAQGVKRTFSENGDYVTEEYTQNVRAEDNDFEAVIVDEEDDLQK